VEWRTPRTQYTESQKEVRARPVLDEDGKGKQSSKAIWVEKEKNRTFVEAVTGVSQEQWKGPSIKSQQHTPHWMAKSFVGNLGDGMDFDKLAEEMVKGGLGMVRARFLGDNLVLLFQENGRLWRT